MATLCTILKFGNNYDKYYGIKIFKQKKTQEFYSRVFYFSTILLQATQLLEHILFDHGISCFDSLVTEPSVVSVISYNFEMVSLVGLKIILP